MKNTTIALHYFNPETDYALACGRKHYNPPKKIALFKREMRLFPATFARKGDYIVVDDAVESNSDSNPYSDAIAGNGLTIVTLKELPSVIAGLGRENVEFKPWGWNHSLLHKMLDAGIPTPLLKTEAEIDKLRELSHRRTSIIMQRSLSQSLAGINVPVATECCDVETAMKFLLQEGDAYFKLPWSSSGRGVIHAADMSHDKVEEWISGAIRKQGSVLAEKAFKRSGDFATEWECKNGEAIFLGLSLFKTSSSGRYSGNVAASQETICNALCRLTPFWNDNIIAAQKRVLDVIIAPYYSGPAGIDMLSTDDGRLNPLVEINLRQTMGMAAICSWHNQHQHANQLT